MADNPPRIHARPSAEQSPQSQRVSIITACCKRGASKLEGMSASSSHAYSSLESDVVHSTMRQKPRQGQTRDRDNGLSKELKRPSIVIRVHRVEMRQRAQIEIVSIEIVRSFAPRASDLCLADLRFYDPDDSVGDFVLQIEDILRPPSKRPAQRCARVAASMS